MKKLCIYHANCADGFGAAWVVRRALGEENVEFYRGKHGDLPPDCTGRDVIIVDFSYKRDVMLTLAEEANSVLVIDHHKTAAESLVDLPYCRFDMDHSGAMLTWMHYFHDEEPPALLKHIEDRDLWRFKLSGTREIQAALFSYHYDFQVWDDLMMDTGMWLLQHEGEVLERKHFKDIGELLKVTKRIMIIGDHEVEVANLPYTMSSDAGHILAQTNPFGACYYDTPTGREFSLRSTDEGVDVSQIALMYGGGGHRNAAGFKVTFEQALQFEVKP